MKKWLVILGALIVTAAVLAGVAYVLFQRRLDEFAATSFGQGVVTVSIAPGSSPKSVSRVLAEAKIIADPDLMYYWLKREKLGPKLRAGEYEFTGPITPREVVDKVIAGQIKLYRFTVPEGLRVDEILPIIAASELKFDLNKLKTLAATPAFVRKVGVPADGLEGFLFPDTYSFPRGTTEEMVLTKMVQRTLDEVAKCPRKAGVKLNVLETVTLASIIEKETGASELDQRAHISCVFHNRLRENWRLDTDPTVIYAMMLKRGTYSKNITKADLETDHPYNTYRNKGLPPGPIASPGVAALHAALSPIDCPDFFFVSRNDGTSVFCPTNKCHEAAVDEFQRRPFKKKKH